MPLVTRTGRAAVEALTAQLHAVRLAHPTFGSFEAAETEYWWVTPRSTDTLEQLFWLDEDGSPQAAFVVTDFGNGTSLLYEDPTIVISVLPDADPAFVAEIVETGIARLADAGIDTVEIEVGKDDELMRTILTERGFVRKGPAAVEAWLDIATRPAVTELPDGYRLLDRAGHTGDPHHLDRPDRPNTEQRLTQLSMYRPDLDLFIVDDHDEVAAYGIAWFDPVTKVGVFEPMRTADEHQGRGLARHILTTGLDRFAALGADRASIVFDRDNPSSSHLYTDVGFVPHRETDAFSLAVWSPVPTQSADRGRARRWGRRAAFGGVTLVLAAVLFITAYFVLLGALFST